MIPEDQKYCQDSYVNNRRNNRNGAAGSNGIKQTDTVLSRTKDKLCSFYLSLFQDKQGFYFKSQNCNVFHKNHTKRNFIRTSSKNITSSDCKSIRIGDKSCAASSINMNMHYIRNIERSNNPSILSQRQIHYICEDVYPSSKEDRGTKISGNIDNIYKYLQEIRYPHVSLLQKVVGNRIDIETSDTIFSQKKTLMVTY